MKLKQENKNIEKAIEMNHITMRFGSLVANDDITLHVNKGSIHALIGENGAGKSTLMSILFGIYKQTAGFIKIGGKAENIKNPNHATKLGLGMVHQHFKLIDIYNAVENIILGKEITKMNFLLMKEAKNKIENLAKKYNLDVDLKMKIKDMSVGMQQRVEILKMLYTDANILIFDEPTAVLTPQEIQGFLKMLKDFKAKGKTILIISHKLEEIKEIADTATIIRRGKYIDTIDVQKTTISKMASLMVGRNLVEIKNKSLNKKISNDAILSLKNVNVRKSGHNKKMALDNASIEVKPGEIVAIAGVEGNGQSELAQAISGLIKIKSGTIELNGKEISHLNIKNRYKEGLSFVPEDRHKHGLILDMSIGDNISNRTFYLRPYSKFGLLNFRQLNMLSSHVISTFDVRGADNGSSIARSLSGGNQQKAIVGKEMNIKHNLLLAVQPTRGLDLGAIEYIHKRILEEKDEGKGVLLISYELDEIIALSDRIVVLNNGKITGEVITKKTTRNKIGELMARSV